MNSGTESTLLYQPVDHLSPIPYYLQMEQALRERIKRGDLKPGDQIPGEPELCDLFAVSRTVVRQALGELTSEGLLVRCKGRGTFVAEPKITEGLIQKLTGFYQDMSSRGHQVVTQVLKQVVIPASDDITAHLALQPGTPVLQIDRLRFVDSVPLVFVTTYLPYDRCPQLLSEDLTQQSLYAVLQNKYGLVIARGRRMYDYTDLWDSWCIGGSKIPDRLVSMMDWMMTPESLDVTNWGIEKTHYTLKKPRSARIDDYTVPGIEKAMPKDGKELVKAIYEEYAKKADPYRSYQSDTGTGLLDFVMLTDSAVEYLWDPPGETDEWYALTAKELRDGVLHMPALAPAFTAAENDRLKTLYTNINAIMDPAIEKTILGQMSMADYAKEVDKAKKAGAEELEKIYNEAEARAK